MYFNIENLSYLDQEKRYTKWKMAVERSFGWSKVNKSSSMTGILSIIFY